MEAKKEEKEHDDKKVLKKKKEIKDKKSEIHNQVCAKRQKLSGKLKIIVFSAPFTDNQTPR